MKVMVTVNAYVSTMQEIELSDDFDVTDENAMYELAHSEHIELRTVLKKEQEQFEKALKEQQITF